MMGLEPTTPCLQSRCSSQLSYIPLWQSGPADGCVWWDQTARRSSLAPHPSSRDRWDSSLYGPGGRPCEPMMVIR
jgi:hypothetical protein